MKAKLIAFLVLTVTAVSVVIALEKAPQNPAAKAPLNPPTVDKSSPALRPAPTPPPGNKQLWAKSYLGKKAPPFIVDRWLTAKPELTGKFVLIDFWATWCPPCRATIPELNTWSKKFAGKLVVIGVSDEDAATVRAFKSPAIEYFSALDAKKRMSKALDVSGIPHVIVVDPEGFVRWEGFPLLAHYELTEQIITDILAGKDQLPGATNTPSAVTP